jgi:hypothetical protein
MLRMARRAPASPRPGALTSRSRAMSSASTEQPRRSAPFARRPVRPTISSAASTARRVESPWTLSAALPPESIRNAQRRAAAHKSFAVRRPVRATTIAISRAIPAFHPKFARSSSAPGGQSLALHLLGGTVSGLSSIRKSLPLGSLFESWLAYGIGRKEFKIKRFVKKRAP